MTELAVSYRSPEYASTSIDWPFGRACSQCRTIRAGISSRIDCTRRHHRLKPTRFIVISEIKTLRHLVKLLSQKALADLGETESAQLERVKNHPFRAPLLVLALTKFQSHPKNPYFEQTLSSGAAIQNFILSLQAEGF